MIAPHYLHQLALAVAVWFGAVLAFIWVIDPYGVAPLPLTISGVNVMKPKRVEIDRQLKPYEVWRYQPKTVFFGTSRIHQGFDPSALDGTEYDPDYNAAIPASTIQENEVHLRQYLDLDKSL